MKSLWGPQLILWGKLRHITEEMRAFAKQTVEIKKLCVRGQWFHQMSANCLTKISF